MVEHYDSEIGRKCKKFFKDTFEEEEPVDMDAVKQNIANIKKELAEVEAKMEKQFEELGL